MQNRISWLVVGLLLSGPLAAWAQDENHVENAVKVIRIRGDAQQIGSAAAENSGTNYDIVPELNAIVVRGRPDRVASVEQTVHELEALNTTPAARNGGSRNLELTVYVIAGSQKPVEGSQDVSGESLGAVVKQLRAVFPYPHYVSLSSMLIRAAQDSGGNSKGELRSLNGNRPGSYSINFKKIHVSQDNPPAIRLNDFGFESQVWIAVPGSSMGTPISISVQTDVDLRDGQKVVVGKANASNSEDCYFLVLSARVVQ